MYFSSKIYRYSRIIITVWWCIYIFFIYIWIDVYYTRHMPHHTYKNDIRYDIMQKKTDRSKREKKKLICKYSFDFEWLCVRVVRMTYRNVVLNDHKIYSYHNNNNNKYVYELSGSNRWLLKRTTTRQCVGIYSTVVQFGLCHFVPSISLSSFLMEATKR